MSEGVTKKSDLHTRAVSALIMLAVAGAALFIGNVAWSVFVTFVGLCVIVEWWGLASRMMRNSINAAIFTVVGACYVGMAIFAVIELRAAGLAIVLLPLLIVIATDVGAYFSGRTFKGPKIAPAISPSKTWSGLIGGMGGAALVAAVWAYFFAFEQRLIVEPMVEFLLLGALLACLAQAGDFFESWMKRKAGVKDSGTLLPGHGGFFDRADGLLPVVISLYCGWLFVDDLKVNY